MSILETAQAVSSVRREHFRIKSQYESPHSPYIDEMERYYSLNRFQARHKITIATWIPEAVRRHMIRHLSIRKVRTRSRSRALRYIVAHKEKDYVEVKRFRKQPPQVYWSRDRLGRVYLHDYRTKKFVHTTDKEKEFLMKHRREGGERK